MYVKLVVQSYVYAKTAPVSTPHAGIRDFVQRRLPLPFTVRLLVEAKLEKRTLLQTKDDCILISFLEILSWWLTNWTISSLLNQF